MNPLTKSVCNKIHSDSYKYWSEIKAMNEHIAAMIKKLNDTFDKKIEKQLQPISVQITYISSKQSENIQNEVLNITSEHPSSENKFERKSKDNIFPYNQRFEQQEE